LRLSFPEYVLIIITGLVVLTAAMVVAAAGGLPEIRYVTGRR
jgi:hypothetical protein